METYLARKTITHPVTSFGSIKLKMFEICAPSRRPVDVADVIPFVRSRLEPDLGSQVESSGVGYLVIHRANDTDWLLVHLWAEGGILAGTVYNKVDGAFRAVQAPLIECVWESEVAIAERQAWLDTWSAPQDERAALYLASD